MGRITIGEVALRPHAEECARRLEELFARIAEKLEAVAAEAMSNLELALRSRSTVWPAYLTGLPDLPDAAYLLKTIGVMRLALLKFEWRQWARPAQLPPNDNEWKTFFARAGRGFGKTRLAVEWLRERKRYCKHMAIIGETVADVRGVLIEGPSGILECSPPWDMPRYEPSKRKLEWANGHYATTYSGENPEQLRGPQHAAAVVDELAKFHDPGELWTQLQLGMRIAPLDGSPPRVLIATTPKPLALLKQIMGNPQTVTVTGKTYDNADNLAPSFLTTIDALYSGTSIAQQEIYAEFLDEAAGALWSRALLEETRITEAPEPSFWKRTVVAVDPQAGRGRDSTGIVVCSIGRDDHGYVRTDQSGDYSPEGWARRAVDLYHEFGCEFVVLEVNQGGEMAASAIRQVDKKVQIRKVRAMDAKQVRAQPIAMLFEQGRCHLVGSFPKLEDELTSWEPASGAASPDRLDAMAWAFRHLFWGTRERNAGAAPILITT